MNDEKLKSLRYAAIISARARVPLELDDATEILELFQELDRYKALDQQQLKKKEASITRFRIFVLLAMMLLAGGMLGLVVFIVGRLT